MTLNKTIRDVMADRATPHRVRRKLRPFIAKLGRPPKPYTPKQRVIIEREWNSKKHKTRADALRAIRGCGIDVKLTWLYTHVRAP